MILYLAYKYTEVKETGLYHELFPRVPQRRPSY